MKIDSVALVIINKSLIYYCSDWYFGKIIRKFEKDIAKFDTMRYNYNISKKEVICFMMYMILCALCLPALFISLLLFIDSNAVLTSGLTVIKKMRYIILAGIIQAAIYFVDYIICEHNYFENRQLGMVIEVILYICNLYYIFSYANMIFSKYQNELYKKKISRFLFFSPVFVLLILEVLNMFFPVLFDITPTTFEYVETPLAAIAYIIPILYIAFSGFHDIKEWKHNKHYYNLPVSLYFGLMAVGIVLEGVFFDVPILPIFSAVAITLMYIRIVKRTGYLDSLSGLYARAPLSGYVSSQLNKLSSNEMLFGIMLDVNHFKYINDTYGHVVGDRAISSMGQILKEVTKNDGACFRYGGDEFIVISKATDLSQIKDLMNRIDIAVTDFNENNADVFQLSVSQGYSVYESGNSSVVTFVDNMDAEMYKSKSAFKEKMIKSN